MPVLKCAANMMFYSTRVDNLTHFCTKPQNKYNKMILLQMWPLEHYTRVLTITITLTGEHRRRPASNVRRWRTLFVANNIRHAGEHCSTRTFVCSQCSRRTNVRRELAELFACSPRVRHEFAEICLADSAANLHEFTRVRGGFARDRGEQLFAAHSA